MASKAVGLLTFNFGANLDGFDRAMKKSQKKLRKFGNNVKKIGSSLTTNLTLPIAALGVVSVKSFDQQAKAEMKLLTALKGREDIQKRLIEQAKELQKTTLFGDEATIESQALLASLGLTEEQILMLMPQIQNMATALGMDLTAATSLVSKSVSTSTDALARYFDTGLKGVTGQQERAIVLTGALTEKFDGQSEAAAKVGAGPLIQMKNQLGDLTEQLGEKLMPFVIKFLGWLTKLIDKFESLSSTQIENIVKWGLIVAAIGPVLLIVGKAILAYGQLKIAIAAANTFMLANPYVVIAAGIAVLVAGIYNLVKAFTFQVDVQKELKDLNHDAQKSIAGDLVNIKLLTGAIESETSSLEDKKKALNELKATYPGYYDEIDEATFSSDMLKQSTDRLKESLINVARVTAYQDKLEDIQRQIIDLEETGNVDISTSLGVDVLTQNISGPLAPMVKVLDVTTGMFANFKQNIQENIDTREITELTKLSDELANTIAELTKTTDDNNTSIQKVTHTTKKVNEVQSETSETIDKTNSSKKKYNTTQSETNEITEKSVKTFSDLNDVVTLSAETMMSWVQSPIEDQFKGIVVWQTKLTQGQQLLNAGIGMFGEVLTSSLNSAIDSQENFFSVFIKNIKKAITSLLIQLAVMSLISMMMGGGAAAFNLASIKTNLASVMGVTAFAEGGLVTGPTTALIGEGVGTTASNPEVVAPLDKLKSMIGDGNQNIVVEGKLAGNDIFLSNARTKFNRNRTV